MRKGLYWKLAVSNIKSQRRIYVPYMLAGILSCAMFYMMCFLNFNTGIDDIPYATIGIVLGLGLIVVGIFSVIIMLYSNSFLMKQRKRELGLYNILGMGKRHIRGIMATETLMTGASTMILGIGVGILCSKLMQLLLFFILRENAPLGFEVSPLAILVTVLLFAAIFVIALIYNVARVQLSEPIELLRESQVGEREPKTKWLITLIGLVALLSAYAMAVFITDIALVIMTFFLAVLLVILGTYCLFTSGSIALLKGLRANKRYYYTTRHFTSVSGMLYRMKQNAVGLANICILSTMVLVMLSTTICLYSGMEDSVRTSCPRDFAANVYGGNADKLLAVIPDMDAAVEASGVETSNRVAFRMTQLMTGRDGNEYTPYDSTKNGVEVNIMPLADYNAVYGTDIVLESGEALMYSEEALDFDTVRIGGVDFTIKAEIEKSELFEETKVSNVPTAFLVLPAVEDVVAVSRGMGIVQGDGMRLYYGVDVANEKDDALVADSFWERVLKKDNPYVGEYSWYTRCASEIRGEFLMIYGGLFFLGIFLSLMFTCAAALIMYYKQISEGYDDRRRFEIMQQVGMSRAEVRQTIRSQVLTVFFLPLVTAGIHVAFAFPMIGRMFSVLTLTNTNLFLMCTVACYIVFALLYAVVYALTARTYYKIVAA